MSPAATEVREAAPFTWGTEEKLLAAVASGKLTAHDAAMALIPNYMDRRDSGVIKIAQAALEDIEFFRDLCKEEHYLDRDALIETSHNLRRHWDRT